MSTSDVLPKISANIARLRSEHGLTLRDIQDETGITISYLNSLERGLKANPSLSNLIALSRVFNVSLDELAGMPGKEQVA